MVVDVLFSAHQEQNTSFEGIANSVGYKSRSNFAAVFKDIVGLTPSAFQKMHREQGTKHTHPED